MNRKERRARRVKNEDASMMWHSNSYAEYKRPKDPKPHIPVPGIDIPPEIPAFTAMVNSNTWHDKPEFQKFVDVINELAVDHWAARDPNAPLIVKIGSQEHKADLAKPKRWSWAYNPNCKYVDFRIDMRDGGFVMKNQNGERINLEQLMWQWRSDEERKKEEIQTNNPVL